MSLLLLPPTWASSVVAGACVVVGDSVIGCGGVNQEDSRRRSHCQDWEVLATACVIVVGREIRISCVVACIVVGNSVIGGGCGSVGGGVGGGGGGVIVGQHWEVRILANSLTAHESFLFPTIFIAPPVPRCKDT